ncbi:MAG: SpoIVB peptidase S55 domain-containing protein [Verrucomicrobiae bacterium]|nr:SpoIVB peptidase S55 domain-containing protein [Verrucomicrobiae bacterium]
MPPPPPIMPLGEVKPGMKGVVYTVFQGGKIESFHVEVTGILDNFLGPKKHVILCRMPDPKTWNSGGTAGMSGSPLLIDGKLVGALSYGLQVFETERFAGFTPIEDMLAINEYDRSVPSKTARIPVQWPQAGRHYDFSGLRPIATPLVVSGVSPQVFNLFAPYFQSLGFEPLQAAGGSDTEKTIDAPFLPGAAVAGVLASGDVGMAGTGTLTWREGNRVLGFGHPFFSGGAMEMPMAQAEIVTILPSLYRSFKVANTRQIIGTITQDRLSAISGEVGKITPMIPVKITLNHPASGSRVVRAQVMQHTQLTPAIMTMVLAKTLMGSPDLSNEFTTRVTGRAKIKGHPDLVFDDIYSASNTGGLMLLLMETASKLTSVYANPFEIPRIESLELTLNMSEKRSTLSLDDLVVDQTRVKPGDTVNLRYWTRSFRGDRSPHTLKVRIPEEIKSGSLRLQIADARTVNNGGPGGGLLALLMAGGQEEARLPELMSRTLSQPRVPLFSRGERPKSVTQIVTLLNREVPQNAFYARLLQRTPGVVIEDKVSENVPASLLSVMGDSRHLDDSTPLADAEIFRETIEMPGVAVGSKTITLEIE